MRREARVERLPCAVLHDIYGRRDPAYAVKDLSVVRQEVQSRAQTNVFTFEPLWTRGELTVPVLHTLAQRITDRRPKGEHLGHSHRGIAGNHLPLGRALEGQRHSLSGAS